MSNYTQQTFFTPKDTLPITDPNKTIFGAAYDVEFASISSAVATKLDSVFANPALVSLNITSIAAVANGFGLSSANVLGVYANNILVATFASNLITFNVPFSFSSVGILTVGGLNVNASALPANGLYLPSANTLGIAINTTQVATIAAGGTVFGGAAGGVQGAGTINATGLFVNGVAVGGGGGTTVGTGAAVLNAAGIAVGQTYIVWRSATLSRSSTTTPTADAVLQLTGVPIGTYKIDSVGYFQSSAVASGGAQMLLSNSAGTVTGFYTMVASLNSSTSSANVVQSVLSQVPWASLTSTQSIGGTTAWGDTISCHGAITVTVSAATLTLNWAQVASSGTAVIIQPGSYIAITRLA